MAAAGGPDRRAVRRGRASSYGNIGSAESRPAVRARYHCRFAKRCAHPVRKQTMSSPRIVRTPERDRRRRAVRARSPDSARRRPASQPKYFYDPLGCALYGAICELPEYYLTRTERTIFDAHRAEIARAIGRGRQFVDLGAGDCRKGETWLGWIVPSRYIAVDIAEEAIGEALARMAPRHPSIDMLGRRHRLRRRARFRGATSPTRPRRSSIPARRSATSRRTRRCASSRGIRRHCVVPGQRPPDRRRHGQAARRGSRQPTPTRSASRRRSTATRSTT